MFTTDKYNCRLVAAALVRYGVRRAVVSPGSRNAPLIVALARRREIQLNEVIDERSAAFVALGIAVQTGRPVAVVCTSGSAVLNLAPALAEAYYRQIPLIAVTADRPEEWIDQDDSQTIRQPGALAAVTKATFHLPVTRGDAGLERLCRRRVADAMMMAVSDPCGPVHVNVGIDEPINVMGDDSADDFRLPDFVPTVRRLPEATARELAIEINSVRQVLVVAGFRSPEPKLKEALSMLPGNVAVISELQSNLGQGFPANIDAMLRMPESEALLNPDIVITIGGALLSRMIKAHMRSAKKSMRHWSVSTVDHCLDTMLHLDRRIDCAPTEFFASLLPYLEDNDSCYAAEWQSLSERAGHITQAYAESAPWSDFRAMNRLMRGVPSGTSLHLSNGTAARYAQLTGCPGAIRTECNRGVSGIDGCTSTAIGAAMATDELTLLVTGDMSAQYDMGALAIQEVPATFRMAVLNNGGGGIFRFIKSTRDLPETDRWLAGGVRLPLRELAAGFGFDYYEAADEASLSSVMPAFFAPSGRPAILNIITPPDASAETIKRYFA